MRYPIWREGYAVTGQWSPAAHLGEAAGESFREACRGFFEAHPEGRYYDPVTNSHWGCRLFNNEADARGDF